MQNRILVIFAHPLFEKSRIHKALVSCIPDEVTFHDLYEAYPDFNIDVEQEKELLLAHDVIIWEHPLYWYSCPAILKQWIDMVLEPGWAYGQGGTALANKMVFQVLSTGGNITTYLPEGFHRYTLEEFLLPFKRTAQLCNMKYLPPFVAHGSHRMSEQEMASLGADYQAILTGFMSHIPDFETLEKYKYLNDWLTENNKV
jgi:glutathione-regulated potassium-efflux system ancillary protein KefG